MCTGGRTVVQQQPSPNLANQPPKPVIYMRNSWLDGLGINAEERGRNSLRIDSGSPTPMKPMRTGGPNPAIPIAKPNLGIQPPGPRINDGGYRRGGGLGIGRF